MAIMGPGFCYQDIIERCRAVSSGVIQQQALAQCSVVVVNEDGVVERVKQLSGLQSAE